MLLMRKVNLDVIEDGAIEDFLGFNINRKEGDLIHLIQPLLIDAILKALHLLEPAVNTQSTPVYSSNIWKQHSNSEEFDKSFIYQLVERGSYSNILSVMYQWARFFSNPKN